MNAEERGWRKEKTLVFLTFVAWLVVVGFCDGGYYEFNTFDHQKAYEYLDKVEAAVGTDEFEVLHGF